MSPQPRHEFLNCGVSPSLQTAPRACHGVLSFLCVIGLPRHGGLERAGNQEDAGGEEEAAGGGEEEQGVDDLGFFICSCLFIFLCSFFSIYSCLHGLFSQRIHHCVDVGILLSFLFPYVRNRSPRGYPKPLPSR